MRSRFDLAGYTYSATVGGIPSIFTIEPANIKAIFADKFDDFDAGWLRRRAFAPAIGDVLITSDGPRWRHQRAMLRPAFNKQQFSDYDMFEHDIDTLINRIPKDGSTIDLAPLFYTHALTLASRLLFDEPIASLNPEFADSSDRFIEAFHRVNKGNQLRLRMGRFLPIQRRDRSYEAGCEIVHEYGDAFVKRASEYRVSFGKNGVHQNDKPGDRYVFLRELAKEIEDSVELRNHLVGMLLVGSETTAGLLTGCLSVLSSRPHLWAKLHREAVDLGVPNNEAVKAFTSLSHVINEVLRLYPILPLFGRMANKDTFLPIGAGPDVSTEEQTFLGVILMSLSRRGGSKRIDRAIGAICLLEAVRESALASNTH
ncbi:hypothetical protein MMC21_007066 [Puttea exsequens]|nr:hypothetical protein [Puttea exsequens]